MNSGTFELESGGGFPTFAFGVRCVPDLKSADNCNPNIVWSGTKDSAYSDRYLNSGTFNYEALSAGTYALTVRCVPDLDFLKQKKFQW